MGGPLDRHGEALLGRHPDDASALFPRFTTASVTTTGDVTVNGRTVHLWTYSQLEPLSAAVLRTRAIALRDAIGEAICKPITSNQKLELIRWILDSQTSLTNQAPGVGRPGKSGAPDAVPTSFKQDMDLRARPQQAQSAPVAPAFGPKKGQSHDATRDHYDDLLNNRKEFVNADQRYGIVSGKVGGEGRKHLRPASNMEACGVSSVDGNASSGRKPLACVDHLMEQKRDSPSKSDLRSEHVPPARSSGCAVWPGAEEGGESPIGGERRRHANVPDSMVNVGVADPGADENRLAGRKHLDSFGGSKFVASDSNRGYQSTWKSNPSRLQGTSMLC